MGELPIGRMVSDRILASSNSYLLTILSAPVASGKSTVLAEVASKVAGQRPVIFVRGGESNELDRNPAWEADPSALVIVDDADLVPTSLLDRLLRIANHGDISRSPKVILAFSSRPGFPMSSLLLRGRMSEFGQSDLALTHAEAASMLGLNVADMMSPDFRVLMRRTDGWVGAWGLIRNVLDSGQGIEAASRWLHGDTRELETYFSEQIMRPLPADLQRFITLTAPIWPLDAELAAKLHGDDGPSLLHKAYSSCAFLGRQQPGGPPPKPNPLFIEFLLGNGRREFPADQRAYFQAAGDWFLARTDWPRAAQNFVHAGMSDRAAELLSTKSDEIFARFGDVLLVQDDGNSIYGSLANVPQTGPAKDLIRGTILRGSPAIRRKKNGQLGFEEFLADFGRDDLQSVRSSADQWLESEAGTALQRATIANALAVSHLADLRLIDMQQALERATSASAKAKSPFLAAWSAMNWVFLHLERGNHVIAKQTLLTALQEPSVRGLVRHTVTIMLAACERMAGNVAYATELISGSIDLSSRHATSDTMVMGWATAAQCVRQIAGADEALSLLDRATKIAGRRSGERSQYHLRLFAIQMALQSGDRSRIGEMTNEIDQIRTLSSKAHLGRKFDEELRYTSARLFLASGNTREANAIVQPIVQRAHTSGRAKRWTEGMMIRVGAAIAEDNIDAACRLFWHGESGLGGGHSLHQLLMDERELLLPLIPSLKDQVTRAGFTTHQQRLVESLSRGNYVPALAVAPQAPTSLASPAALTRKESDIMRFVAGGLSNHDIGGRLGVSEGTIKWHLRNIYQKLDVKSRTAAIAKLAAG